MFKAHSNKIIQSLIIMRNGERLENLSLNTWKINWILILIRKQTFPVIINVILLNQMLVDVFSDHLQRTILHSLYITILKFIAWLFLTILSLAIPRFKGTFYTLVVVSRCISNYTRFHEHFLSFLVSFFLPILANSWKLHKLFICRCFNIII